MIRVGSFCTGIAGLELGIELAGHRTSTVWVADHDEAASRWLDHNRPEVPNLGDITTITDPLPEVDLITAGFPCQPFSSAGKRHGLNDERYLFDDIAHHVGRMGTRPDLFLENVPGLLTANDGRAMARVVYRLAEIGYGITWGLLDASAVAAPHRRVRWWGYARCLDRDPWVGHPTDGDPGSVGRIPGPGPSPREPRGLGGPGPRHPGNPATADLDRGRCEQLGQPTQPGRQHTHRRSVPGPDRVDALREVFGPYAEAVARWERVLGRTCPAPTHRGGLSPWFDEFHMGYPEGWVTDTPELSVPEQLAMFGNSVVPQCAAVAFAQLRARSIT